MKVNYSPCKASLKPGVPYTYGSGCNWYVLLVDGTVIFLNDPDGVCAIAEWAAKEHQERATCYKGFRYAQSMEIL